MNYIKIYTELNNDVQRKTIFIKLKMYFWDSKHLFKIQFYNGRQLQQFMLKSFYMYLFNNIIQFANKQ